MPELRRFLARPYQSPHDVRAEIARMWESGIDRDTILDALDTVYGQSWEAHRAERLTEHGIWMPEPHAVGIQPPGRRRPSRVNARVQSERRAA